MSTFSLNSIIAKKKRDLVQEGAPATKKQKKYRSKREIEAEKRLQEEAETAQHAKDHPEEQEEASVVEQSTTTETTEEKPQYEREEVIKRLRQAGLVVTFFGESDWEREQRWLQHDTSSKEDSSYSKGRKNDFDDLMRNLLPGTADDIDEDTPVVDKEDTKAHEAFLHAPIETIFDGLEDLCDEDRVLLLFRRLLEEWKLEINSNTEEHYRTIQGRKLMVTVQQSENYLRPLFKSLKQRTLSKDILACLRKMVDAVVDRNYTQAGDFYIQMAVGNAPWPIGVTMVGIHERSAREKIFSNQVAHVLNDETQRKYIQSVYRLIKYCQKTYPAPPSRSIG